jgi:hypothetical protein
MRYAPAATLLIDHRQSAGHLKMIPCSEVSDPSCTQGDVSAMSPCVCDRGFHHNRKTAIPLRMRCIRIRLSGFPARGRATYSLSGSGPGFAGLSLSSCRRWSVSGRRRVWCGACHAFSGEAVRLHQSVFVCVVRAGSVASVLAPSVTGATAAPDGAVELDISLAGVLTCSAASRWMRTCSQAACA